MFDLPELPASKVPNHPGIRPRGLSLATSQGRFHARIWKFREQGRPVAAHHFWWFVHNAIAHPLIAVLPVGWTFAFHDYTSSKINGK